ncbi:MAG TPA: hypothetical protein VGJ91_21245, partial [Polyangiaceae bacterium]
TAFDRTNGGGMAFDGKNYGISFSGHEQRWSSYFSSLSRTGGAIVAETPLAEINSETYAGSLLHNGSYFASAWADARQDGNYEVYFNRYDSRGQKLGPDLRISRAPNFSLDPALVWNGTESILVWDDRRAEARQGDDVRLFGQRVAFDGSLIGGNVELTGAGTLAESPGIALGPTRVGIVFASRLPGMLTHAIFFSTKPDLTEARPFVDLGGIDVQNPSLVEVADRFAAFWESNGDNHGPSIYGAAVDDRGNILRDARPVTSGASHARSFSVISLGDRLVLVWADDHDGNYELYLEILDKDLNLLTPRTRLTFSPSDSLAPVAALGPSGDLGVLYDDWQSGDRQTYFLGMSCIMGGSVSPQN